MQFLTVKFMILDKFKWISDLVIGLTCMFPNFQIPADSQSLQSGYLTLKSGEGLFGSGSRQPQKRWFALLPDFVLYSFKSEESTEALTATPIPGHTILGGAEIKSDTNVSDKDKERVIKLFYASNQFNNNSNAHPVPVVARKTYYLTGNSKDEMERLAR